MRGKGGMPDMEQFWYSFHYRLWICKCMTHYLLSPLRSPGKKIKFDVSWILHSLIPRYAKALKCPRNLAFSRSCLRAGRTCAMIQWWSGSYAGEKNTWPETKTEQDVRTLVTMVRLGHTWGHRRKCCLFMFVLSIEIHSGARAAKLQWNMSSIVKHR